MFGRVRRPTHVIGSYYSLLKGSHQAYFVKWLRGHQKGFWLFSWLSHFFLSKGIGQMNSFPKKAGLNKLRIDLAFSFFLSSVLICHPQTSIATTYAPPQPDPWYSISVEFTRSMGVRSIFLTFPSRSNILPPWPDHYASNTLGRSITSPVEETKEEPSSAMTRTGRVFWIFCTT